MLSKNPGIYRCLSICDDSGDDVGIIAGKRINQDQIILLIARILECIVEFFVYM